MTIPSEPWRLWVHALDRTGPPMLARSVLRWLARTHPDIPIETVAFRGGPMLEEFAAFGPVTVVLDDREPWDAWNPDPVRFEDRARRLAHLGPARINLLVSVAAGQALPLAPSDVGPIATWSVEIGDDLHWLDDPIGLVERTDRWLAGSDATADELRTRLSDQVPPGELPVLVEFIDPDPVDPRQVESVRAELLGDHAGLLVVGAGIGTWRKGIDLFLEAAHLHAERSRTPAVFVWFGGEDDPLAPLVAAEAARTGTPHVQVRPAVASIDPVLAAADVFLHPARFDAFPLVGLHAGAQGTPTVGFTGVGGLSEMFGAATLGAPYPDLVGLVDHVQALEDPDRRAAAGAAQRLRIEDRYLAEGAAPELFACVDSLAGLDGADR